MPNKRDQMKQIKEELLNLKDSPLFEYRTENKFFPVIGEGSHDAQIVFVGEAPGKNEAMTGRPFCGASGKILDELLSHIGVDRQDVYITNVVKDRPENNRDPKPSEIEIYSPFLDRQLEIIKPKVVAPLGRFSKDYLMKKFDLDFDNGPISQIHGKKFKTKTSWGEIYVVPLYHPAVAVYNRNQLPDLQKDFEVLKELVK